MDEGLSESTVREVKPVVNAALCFGCGLCAEQCPQKAIVVIGTAHISLERCKSCGRCIDVCPQRAIREPMTVDVLREAVREMIGQTDHLLSRIQNMENSVARH